jgi:hypothetical protein
MMSPGDPVAALADNLWHSIVGRSMINPMTGRSSHGEAEQVAGERALK